MTAMAMMIAAIPEKIAPTTKYGPKMVECHMGWTVMAKTQETTVWTETAMGITRTAMAAMRVSRMCFCLSVPVHPSARRR
jgi:hypothetical protein